MELIPQYRVLFAEVKTKTGKQQKDIASELGFKEQTLSSWVSGRSHPRMYEGFVLARYLTDLLGREIKVDDLYRWAEK